MIDLTEEQRQELAGPQPVQVRDPQTKETYVLVRSELYERLKALLQDDSDAEGMYSRLADIAPEDWEDAANYDFPSTQP